MKRLFSAILLICAITIFFAAKQAYAITLKGDIIDNLCADSQSPDELAEFVKTHTKEGSFVINLHIFLDLIARNADEFSV